MSDGSSSDDDVSDYAISPKRAAAAIAASDCRDVESMWGLINDLWKADGKDLIRETKQNDDGDLALYLHDVMQRLVDDPQAKARGTPVVLCMALLLRWSMAHASEGEYGRDDVLEEVVRRVCAGEV